MASQLATIGMLDLSFVTDKLIDLLTDSFNNWELWAPLGGGVSGEVTKFTINISGSAPESVRHLGDCQLSLYLFHVSSDPYQRNSPVVGPRNQPIPAQPLSLNLYYLLSAFAKDDYHKEQQAMSIAMRCFHQNPIVRATVPIPVLPPPAPLQSQPEEFTLVMESENLDSLSRLWQSITSPMRLAAIYKASVIFMTPPVPLVRLARGVQQINLAADPSTLPFAKDGQLIGSYRKVTYTTPSSVTTLHPVVSYDSSAATAAAGQTLILYGAGLSDGKGNPNPKTSRLYLLNPDGTEIELINWIVPDVDSNLPHNTVVLDSRLTLKVPAVPPDPGVYQLRVGDATTYRSNAVPVCIAAAVTGRPLPPAPPILAANTFQGVGFISQKTEVLLDTIPLAEGPVQAGNFQISGAGTMINFQPPTGIPKGLYALRVRVNKVESDPSWWVSIP